MKNKILDCLVCRNETNDWSRELSNNWCLCSEDCEEYFDSIDEKEDADEYMSLEEA